MVKVKFATFLLVTILALLPMAATAQTQPMFPDYNYRLMPSAQAVPVQVVPRKLVPVQGGVPAGMPVGTGTWMPPVAPKLPPMRPMQPFPFVTWTVDAKSVFGRASINWHDDETSLLAERAWGELGVNLAIADRCRLRYAMTTQVSSAETVTPARALIIGKTDFGVSTTGGSGVGGAGQQASPISIDYSILPSHQFAIVCLSFRHELHPVIIAERAQVSVSGSTTTGQQKKDSEILRSWFWGIGAEAVIPIPNARAMATMAVGDKYSLVDCSYYHRIWNRIALGAGWQHKSFKFGNGNTLRMGGPYVGAEIVF